MNNNTELLPPSLVVSSVYLFFMQSLLTFLNDKVVFEGLLDPSSSSTALTFPYNNILEWAGLILDTHFTSLSLMPEAKIVLVNLHKRVTKQVWLNNLVILLLPVLLSCVDCISLSSISARGRQKHWKTVTRR